MLLALDFRLLALTRHGRLAMIMSVSMTSPKML
jgi:hypothetical protein